MEVVIDPDVKRVAEFMQSKIDARKLVGVAESLRNMAMMLWGHYERDRFNALELRGESITCASQQAAIELEHSNPCVDDDSAPVVVAL